MNRARAEVVEGDHDQRMYRALVERALRPVQAKAAVDTEYGAFRAAPAPTPVQAAGAPAVNEKGEGAHTQRGIAQRATQPVETNLADPFGYGALIALARTTAAPKPDATATPAPVRATMEGARGTDFSDVRVHPGSAPHDAEEQRSIGIHDDARSHATALRLGAWAYSHRGDVFLGPGLGLPGAPSREYALRHELVHARQARRRGPRASVAELEREAHDPTVEQPTLAADPDAVLGLWWVIPAVAGLYVLLRPNVANAPGPGDTTQPSVSELQVAGEALALFAVPAGVTGALARLGYGVVASFAIGGAASSVTYRGVQDIGGGSFSGAEAYVIDAATGAVIGVVIGGAFHALGRALPGPRASTPPLVHFTDPAGHAGITSSGVLRGSQGIYTLPATATQQGTAQRFLRTLVAPSRTARHVPIPQQSLGQFSRPLPVGPISAYQRLAGVYRAPAGSINLLTGEFTASGSRLANITGQFWPYGIDAIIWASGAAMASGLSPTTPEGRERGLSPLFASVLARPPLPETSRSDGPFVFVDPAVLSAELGPTSSDQGAEANACVAPEPICALPEDGQRGEAPGAGPAIILVSPLQASFGDVGTLQPGEAVFP
ncbi:eCIS core domain-containing protein [Sorangium sp. So ce861]|uniref:eCIS core domain-containing protein n=1 Tax=Sorangium sp. So ce861 TaxID=3133323 RepID=UPI003F5FC9B3